MKRSFGKSLFCISILLVFLTAACATGQKPAAVSATQEAQPVVDASSSTPEPAPASDAPLFGYVGLCPAAYLVPESGLKVEISNAVFSPETGTLMSYTEKITFPSGTSTILEYHDIAFNVSTGSVDKYLVNVDGSEQPAPGSADFKANENELVNVIAFAFEAFAGNEPLPSVAIPCQGESQVEYGYSEQGLQQVLSHQVICTDQTYKLEFSDYAYDNNMGTLTGYTVLLTITP